MFAIEHSTDNNQLFGLQLQKIMKDDHKIIINSKCTELLSYLPLF